ncbi:AAA family ATPase [Brevibacterium jeotgali]|uniref:Flp pilus assembly protein, ATPase CpaE n=1 Tax=Brevibacterium jeotgali TaxID=1262550 RepID=A0A2H1L672_9MICO|nr:chromosome partitioning protein [Brevibacterium jeotgali]TWC03547.1 Flp pilus assembly CpaE family ATPase [Brevibacterium jeotgali]SMY12369.1 Flp pilus assembly protein, ATPase CpaE [Brevibacterium jeotgali]
MIDVIVAVDVEYEASVVAAVSSLPDAQVVRRPAEEVELLALVAGGTGHVVVLSRWFPGVDADVVARMHEAGARIVGFGLDEALFARWGITHVLEPGAASQETGAVLRDCADAVQAPPRPTAPPRADGPTTPVGAVTAVWGTGSSPGRSTIALVTAHLLARTAGRTTLVDADTVSSSLTPALGLLDDAPQLAALCRLVVSGAAHDAPAIAERLVVVEPGFEVVTGLSRADRWPEIRGGVLTEVLDRLAARAEHVLVDVSDRIDPDDPYADPHYDRHQATRAVLDRADHVVLVASADPIGLQRLVRLLESDRAVRHADRMTVVVNRVRASAVGPDPEVRIRSVLQRFAGVEDIVLVPDDRVTVDAAVLAGRSPLEVSRRSPLVTALDAALLPRLPGHTARRTRTGRRAGRSRTRAAVPMRQ